MTGLSGHGDWPAAQLGTRRDRSGSSAAVPTTLTLHAVELGGSPRLSVGTRLKSPRAFVGSESSSKNATENVVGGIVFPLVTNVCSRRRTGMSLGALGPTL